MTNEQTIAVFKNMIRSNNEHGNTLLTIGEVQALDMAIEALSAQQWIPCSERLPEEGEVVLTQAKFKDDIKMDVSARVDFNYWTGWGTREINIVAWMPLPEPFKGGDGND